MSYLFLTGPAFLGVLKFFGWCFSRVPAAAPWNSATLHLTGPLLFHRCFLKHLLQMTTIHRVHSLDSSGRTTASLFLYKCFITLLAKTQLEGSASGCVGTLELVTGGSSVAHKTRALW